MQHVTIDLRKLLQELACKLWILENKTIQRSKAIEQEVRIELVFEVVELHFGALPLVGASGDSILDRKSWYLSYCDSDTV